MGNHSWQSNFKIKNIEKQYAMHLECEECTKEIIGLTLDIDPPPGLSLKSENYAVDLSNQFIQPQINSNIRIDTKKSLFILKCTLRSKNGC